MRITIKKLKELIHESMEEGKYNPRTGEWDSDKPGQIGRNSDPNVMKRRRLGGFAAGQLDPVADQRMSSQGFDDLDMKNDDFFGSEIDNDELRDDYLSSTQQGAHEQDPMLHGVKPSLQDPLYDKDNDHEEVNDEMDPDFREMGWQRLAHEKNGRDW